MSDELKPCPFCGGEARLQEFDDGSGGVICSECGFMPLTHASYGRNKSKQKAIAEWNRRPESDLEENKPLTLDELKQRDGEPVYLQFGDGGQGWAIACNDGEWMSFSGVDFEDECPPMEYLNMEYQDPAGSYGLHVLGWRAYRSKPDKEV